MYHEIHNILLPHLKITTCFHLQTGTYTRTHTRTHTHTHVYTHTLTHTHTHSTHTCSGSSRESERVVPGQRLHVREDITHGVYVEGLGEHCVDSGALCVCMCVCCVGEWVRICVCVWVVCMYVCVYVCV